MQDPRTYVSESLSYTPHTFQRPPQNVGLPPVPLIAPPDGPSCTCTPGRTAAATLLSSSSSSLSGPLYPIFMATVVRALTTTSIVCSRGRLQPSTGHRHDHQSHHHGCFDRQAQSHGPSSTINGFLRPVRNLPSYRWQNRVFMVCEPRSDVAPGRKAVRRGSSGRYIIQAENKPQNVWVLPY